MSNSKFFGYSYFSGANAYVKLNGLPALETAGITYSVQESTAPIYGYSSRIFDAVALGQKIIRGSLVINFIHPNYLAKIISLSKASADLAGEYRDLSYIRNGIENKSFNVQMAKGTNSESAKKALNSINQYNNYDVKKKNFEDKIAEWIKMSEDAKALYDTNVSALFNDVYHNIFIEAEAANQKFRDQRKSESSTLPFYDIPDAISNPLSEESYIQRMDPFSKPNWEEEEEYAVPVPYLDQLDEAARQFDDQVESLAWLKKQLINSAGKRLKKAVQDDEDLMYYGLPGNPYSNEYENSIKFLEENSVGGAFNMQKQKLETLINDLKKDNSKTDINSTLSRLSGLEKAQQEVYVLGGLDSEAGIEISNDIGLLGPFNIDIQFAEEYTIRIIDAFLTSRGSMIQIDENAIVEEYSFFARDIKYF